MAEAHPADREQAWLFAHKLITLTKAVREFAAADQLHVTTQELCKAMGRPDGAELEQVQRFAREVAEFMAGYGLDTACGCGYLAFTIEPEGVWEQAAAAGREPSAYTPRDVDEAWGALVAGRPAPPGQS